MLFKSHLLVLLIFCCLVVDAQTPADSWYFGYSAGVQFDMDTIYADTHSNVNAPNGGATWSSSSGDLLFYAGQFRVHNRNHEMMPNGIFSFGGNAAQTPVVCPNTVDNSEYFLFSLGGQFVFYNQLRYSVISMNLDGGLGDIDTSRKRIFLRDSLSGNMTSFPKCDGTGYWLIVCDAYNTNFYVYSISNGVLDTVPQIFQGDVVPNNFGARFGEMNVSPDGARLALVNAHESKVEFLDFDAQTGQLSNPFSVNIGSYLNQMPYGLEFSPSGDQLYVSCNSALATIVEAMLVQLNLTQYDSVSIANSIDTILLDSFYAYSQQTGPDGRIYIAARDTFLHCILNPDSAGQSCGFTLNHIDLSGRFSHAGLPQFDQGSLTNPINDRVYCLGDTAFFEYDDSCLMSLLWNFGDGNTSTSNDVFHVFSDTGVYSASLEITYSAATKTHANTITVLPNQIMEEFSDTIYVCDSTLCVNQSLVNYAWSTGETSRCISISEEGTYSVTLSNACDTLIESVVVITSHVYAGVILSQQQNGGVLLTTGIGLNYQWNTGDTSQSITATTPGTYSVTYSDDDGCIYEAEIVLDEDDFVGITSVSDDIDFHIYPNPAGSSFFIECSGAAVCSLTITDIAGQLLQSSVVECGNPQQIELHQIETGVYFVTLKNQESSVVRKIVVQK
ncbi:MAG: hypothetical protein Salg2KO_02160 [Salibacteraceae bacterium]